MAKERTTITISADTKEQLLQYGREKHIPGGLSGVLEYIAWNDIKVKNPQVKGQMNALEFLKSASSRRKKKYFDRNGEEIKAGMTLYFGTPEQGSNHPVVEHEGKLCFDDCYLGGGGYIPLDECDVSESIISYDPERGLVYNPNEDK